MKNLLLVLLLVPFLLLLGAQDTPNLYEVINITVKAGQEDEFEAAIKAHNAQFHGEGIYYAALFYNVNGPNGGTYSWIMGPTTWTAMDSRPGEGGHDDDWAKVGEHIESASSPEYWNGSVALSHITEGPMGSKSLLWVYDLKNGKGAQFAELIGKVKKVYEAKRPTETFLFAWNAFANDKGQDAVLVFPMENWAELDDNRNFGDAFEEVHGEGTWHNFLNHIQECVKKRVDTIRETID